MRRPVADGVLHTIEFEVSRNADDETQLEPVVDGTPLRDLVGTFEREHGYEPAGSYAGLVAELFSYGDLGKYMTGRERKLRSRARHAWLLGCECGGVGCWPLEARIGVTDATITWSRFRQPHRPKWKYEGFGPFTFERAQYEAAIAEAVRALRDGGL